MSTIQLQVAKNGLEKAQSDFVEVAIVTSLRQQDMPIAKRFPRDTTVGQLKQKLEIITGRNPGSMSLSLLDPQGKCLCQLSDDSQTLGSYPILAGTQLYVNDPTYTSLEDDEQIENRYQLSDDRYTGMRGTLKDYLKTNKLGKYDPEHIRKEQERALKQAEEEAAEVEKMQTVELGNRCQVTVTGSTFPKRGVVMYKGVVGTRQGVWIGVKYDEPYGTNDGTVDGVEYFQALSTYGDFVKPSQVQVGDFPELPSDLDEF